MASTSDSAVDTLIVGGRIVDGTGNPWFYGDIAIVGEIIAQVRPPGTIDPTSARRLSMPAATSSHPDSSTSSPTRSSRGSPTPLLSKVTQGVTTEIR